jgi:drug/metabolite transporter (DMT)-like permease
VFKKYYNLPLEIQGIIVMMLSQFFFASNDAFVKYILSFHDNNISVLGQIVFIRGVITTLLIGLILYFQRQLELQIMLGSRKLWIRGLIEGGCAIFFFLGLATLPLGDLYVLLNLAPIIITASAAIILKETVGWRRWSAVIIGFMGVVIVINPTKLEFGFAFIFPLLAALLIAYRDTYTRQFQFKFDSIQIAFVTSLVVTIIFGIFMLFHFVPMTFKEFIFIVCSAILLAFGYICAVATIKIATMSTTSTFRYTVIIWGIMYGYFFFNEIPSLNMIIGSSIVVASGLFIIYRQKKIGIIN